MDTDQAASFNFTTKLLKYISRSEQITTVVNDREKGLNLSEPRHVISNNVAF